jgi:hypothetical protein
MIYGGVMKSTIGGTKVLVIASRKILSASPFLVYRLLSM